MGTEAAETATETPWNSEAKARFESKRNSEFFDPCQEAAAKSIRCLHRNATDRDMCTDYFQAYRDCKKQWMTERKDQKWKDRINTTASSK